MIESVNLTFKFIIEHRQQVHAFYKSMHFK